MVELKIGVSIQYRMDGGLFNLHRFMTKSKTLTTKSRDLLFAHDCALVAHSADGMQEIVNSFAKAAISFGLIANKYQENGVHVSANSWYSKCWQRHFGEW